MPLVLPGKPLLSLVMDSLASAGHWYLWGACQPLSAVQCVVDVQSEFRHKALPAAEPLPPPPRLPHVPWEGQSTSQITYVAHPVRHTLLPPPPPRVVPPFYGTCTSHADYQAHPPVPRRPSVGLAMAGGRLHVLIPSIIPLPAIGTAELTTCHDNQTEMQLLVCEGELAHGGRLLAALPISGLPAGWRRGDVRVQVRETNSGAR